MRNIEKKRERTLEEIAQSEAITINEYCRLYGVSYNTAAAVFRAPIHKKAGLVIKVNIAKRGGYRLLLQEYIKYKKAESAGR